VTISNSIEQINKFILAIVQWSQPVYKTYIPHVEIRIIANNAEPALLIRPAQTATIDL
jgi:hypothetical protein